PCGIRLASLTGTGINWAGDDTARVWDVDPRATLPVLRRHKRAVYPVTFSPDGRWLASGRWDKTVRLRDAATVEPGAAPFPQPGIVPCLAYSPDGSWLVSGNYADDRLRVWDVATGQIREIPISSGNPRFVTVSPDGRRVAVTAFDPKTKKHYLHVSDI